MAAIFFVKISQEIFKSEHYKLIVHCKPLKPILSEIDTLLQKNLCAQRVRLQQRHNQSEQSDQNWAMTTPNTNEAILTI